MVAAVVVPVMVGVVMLVFLSVANRPVSDAAGRTGVPVLAGAVTSMVIRTEGEEPLTLPATSVTLTVTVFAPVVRALEVMLYDPAVVGPAPMRVAVL